VLHIEISTAYAFQYNMFRILQQPLQLPERQFEIGQKIEVTDPADPKVAHIASVVQVHGYRVRLRPDGCDSDSDFWRLAYSPDIHPVGYCDTSGQKILLPLGKVLRLNV